MRVANTNYILDASVVLAVLLPDERSLDFAKQNLIILTDRNNHFFSCSLLQYEVLNGLVNAIRQKRIDKEDLPTLLHSFNKIPYQQIKINRQGVLDLVLKYSLSVYDASYLWLAKEKKAQLLSLDKRLIEAVKQSNEGI